MYFAQNIVYITRTIQRVLTLSAQIYVMTTEYVQYVVVTA